MTTLAAPRRRHRAPARVLPGAALGVAALAGSWPLARRAEIHPAEATVLRALNERSDRPALAVNIAMQYGALASPWVLATVAAVRRDRVTAAVLAGAGTVTWGLAKVVKQRVGRGRPGDHVPATRVRGRPQTGLGFPSGHAAVATCCSVLLWSRVPAPLRPVVAGLAGGTALARVYVGAHLPLDVVGGAGIGLAVGSIASALLPR